MSRTVGGEAPFVGKEREALVAWLLRCFDRIESEGQPLWVSLEAPTGWGKTRVVHEFFKELAAKRQRDPAYWPRSILDGLPTLASDGLDSPEGRRKRVYPEVVSRPAGALPDWFWWGISCAHRGGVPTQALTEDLKQWAAHSEFVDLAVRRQLSAAKRARRAFKGQGSDYGHTIASDVAGVAASAAGATIPVLGLLYTLSKHSIDAARESARVRAAVASGGVIDIPEGVGDLVDEFVPPLIEVTNLGLPAVVFVEDLHLADPMLVEFLCRLLAAENAAILVVTTTWPGELDEDRGPGLELQTRVSPERLIRVSEHEDVSTSGEQAPGTFVALSEEDLAVLARHLLPALDEPSVALLVERFPSPLALEIVTGLRRIRRRHSAGGTLTVMPADIDALPNEIEGLYEAAWAELPEPVRLGLSLAVRATPESISEAWGAGDDRWDGDLVRRSIAELDHLYYELGDLQETLDDMPTAYSWARAVDAWLRRCHDPAQLQIALRHSLDYYDELDDIGPYLKALSHVSFDGDASGAETRREHLSRLIVALAAEGHAAPSESTILAAQWLAEQAALQAGAETELVELARRGLDDAVSLGREHTAPGRRLRQLLAHGLVGLGRSRAALMLLRPLVEELLEEDGPSSEAVLVLKQEMARALRGLGNLDQATAVLEEVVEFRSRTDTGLSASVLRARGELAFTHSRRGRLAEAESMLRELVRDRGALLGPRHSDTLRTRHDLAAVVRRQGRLHEALELFEDVLAEQTRLLGPEHPDVLSTRQTHAAVLRGLGRYQESADAFRSLVADRSRILGPTHPQTFSARSNLAWVLRRQRRFDEAERSFRELIEIAEANFDPHSAPLLEVTHNLGVVLRESGKLAESTAVIEGVVHERRTHFGPNHPSTLTAEAEWALSRLAVDPLSVSPGEVHRLIDERSRLLGPNSPDTLTSRFHLALVLGAQGAADEAVDLLQSLVWEQARTIGVDHPETIRSRRQLAIELGRAGRVGEGRQLLEELLRQCEELFGVEHPDSQVARDLLGLDPSS